MFDVAWSEVLVVLVVAIVLISPKDIPGVLKHFREMRGKLQLIKSNFTHLWQQIVQESDLAQDKVNLDLELKKINLHLSDTLSSTSHSEVTKDAEQSRNNTAE